MLHAQGTNLDSRQIYFVNQIVEFIVHNGTIKAKVRESN